MSCIEIVPKKENRYILVQKAIFTGQNGSDSAYNLLSSLGCIWSFLSWKGT